MLLSGSSTSELIHLPSTLVARVMLRNSRIRQGLSLDAPLYFPGHSTRVFFRVTNIGQGGAAEILEHGGAAFPVR